MYSVVHTVIIFILCNRVPRRVNGFLKGFAILQALHLCCAHCVRARTANTTAINTVVPILPLSKYVNLSWTYSLNQCRLNKEMFKFLYNISDHWKRQFYSKIWNNCFIWRRLKIVCPEVSTVDHSLEVNLEFASPFHPFSALKKPHVLPHTYPHPRMLFKNYTYFFKTLVVVFCTYFSFSDYG